MSQRLRNFFQNLRVAAQNDPARLTALKGAIGRNPSGYKAADQSVTSSVVMVNDDSLYAELQPGNYAFDAWIPVTLAAASNINLQFVAAEGLSVGAIKANFTFNLDATAAHLVQVTALASAADGAAASAWTEVKVSGSVNVTAAGILQLQWSQKVSGGTATVVKSGATFNVFEAT